MDNEVSQTLTDPGEAVFRKWLTILGPFAGLILVILIFTVMTGTPEKYLSPFNIRVILSQTVIVAISAIGMTLIIISGGIDLSVGSTIALASVVTALCINAGFDPVIAVFAGICVGGIVGFVNGSLITALRVVPFIVTLGMLGIARGAAKWIANQEPVNVPPTWINELVVTFPNPPWLQLAPGVWITILLAILIAVVLRNTVFGRRVFVLGSNEAAARACGISTGKLRIWISLISTKGRDNTSLLRLLPGTSNNDDIEAVGEGFGTDLPNISGQRGRSTVPTVDGLNAGEPSGSNKLSMTINQDAVAEVKVLRNNYAAEYGNNGGAIINLVSKGGGKDYKGTAYYFLRNEALNANQFFSNRQSLKRGMYRHNIWGFNFGGPLPLLRFGENESMFIKDKAFFFFSYEKPHTITPQDPRFVTVPTALERSGDFSQSRNSTNAQVFIRDPFIVTGLCQATPRESGSGN